MSGLLTQTSVGICERDMDAGVGWGQVQGQPLSPKSGADKERCWGNGGGLSNQLAPSQSTPLYGTCYVPGMGLGTRWRAKRPLLSS